MNEESLHTISLHLLVDRIQRGDDQAQDELVRRVLGRLRRLAGKMLGDFPKVAQWEEADDLLQNALVRMLRSLKSLKPTDTRAFYGLAAEQMRRELLDLNRHYHGALGMGRNETRRDFAAPADSGAGPFEPADPAPSLDQLERWRAFHEAVQKLPAEEREVFGLIIYHGWTQAQIAELLQVTDRTVRRIRQAGLVRLAATLGDDTTLD